MRTFLALPLLALLQVPASAAQLETATFAGGCFWCLQPAFDRLPGVKGTTVGYTGGHARNPTYEEVSSGETGHAEAIAISFDPGVVSYRELLDVFWMIIDPTQSDGQFVDRGSQYRTAVFYHSPAQLQAALDSKARLEREKRFDGRIVTRIEMASTFYPAEEEHQKYYLKQRPRYQLYRRLSGRDGYFERTWGKERDPSRP